MHLACEMFKSPPWLRTLASASVRHTRRLRDNWHKLTTVTLASQRSGFRVRRSMLDSTLRRLLCPADAVSFLFIAHTQPRRRQLNCRSRLSLDLAARDALARPPSHVYEWVVRTKHSRSCANRVPVNTLLAGGFMQIALKRNSYVPLFWPFSCKLHFPIRHFVGEDALRTFWPAFTTRNCISPASGGMQNNVRWRCGKGIESSLEITIL